MDELLVSLRKLGVGCYVGDIFMGAFGYADDLVLLAPSRTAMQLMLDVCQDYAQENNLVFSTDINPRKSKSKCLFMSSSKKSDKPLPLKLYGVDLPWVKTATHLGNELCEDGSMDTDVKQKRANFIDRSLLVREQFSFAHPLEVLRAVSIYCCDHYGSMIWDLKGSMATQYCNSWTTCIKLAWQVPRSTHRYFMDYLSGGMVSLRRDLIGRYSGFYRSLIGSPNREVRIMARVAASDIRSNTARNLRLIEESSGGQTWHDSRAKIRQGLLENEEKVPENQKWRISLLGKFIEERDSLVYQGLSDSSLCTEIQSLIDSLCSS